MNHFDRKVTPRISGQRPLAEAKTTIWSKFPRATISFDWRQHAAITARAVAQGTTFSEAVRSIIDEAIEKKLLTQDQATGGDPHKPV